ncbi:MAG: NTP transferase domain-containing protein [Candidatus Omnitrophica bacterium]|nr:NTP transferase domain-containing protein [Candidatus Omnitrophota bacterium]MCF7893458.1 NTP transferase domain-containing protein [Candidatus Omnitrophota bacterium]
MNKTTAIILAAGKGKRMKSSLPKVLRKVCGQSLIYYVLKQLSKIKTIKQIVIVVGYKGDLVKKEVEALSSGQLKNLSGKIKFVNQTKMWGTADAVKVALSKVKNKEALVTCGDNPLIRSATLSKFMSYSRRNNLDCCILTSTIDKKNQLGMIMYDSQGKVQAIKEKLSPKGKAKNFISRGEVNSGTYYFSKKELSKNIGKIKRNKLKKEYFLTDIIKILANQGRRIKTYLAKDSSEVAGINNLFELQFAEKVVKTRVISRLTEKGVVVVDPSTTIVQESVKIGKNTTIYPFTFIEKGAIIGSNCSLGPFVHIRAGTRIRDGVKAGNFLEINRSQLGKGVTAKHFGYLGDTVVSDNVNIGAGTVVANYDGRRKHKTYIKENSFIGCDTVLVAPVTIGKNSKTGAGSVVTKNVKEKEVVIGVPAHLLKAKE